MYELKTFLFLLLLILIVWRKYINHFQNIRVLCSQLFLFETIVLDFKQYSGHEQTIF